MPGPFDAWLTLRGIKTLALRMERHCANAKQLANWLSGQTCVSRVYYPGLPSHPGHELARRQMRDFGGMISVSLKGGKEAALRLLTRTKLFSLAESLGGVESLIGHPATMTHAGYTQPERERVLRDELEVLQSAQRLSVAAWQARQHMAEIVRGDVTGEA